MLCLRCVRGLRFTSKSSIVTGAVQLVATNALVKRTFSSFPSLRPTIFPSTIKSSRPTPLPSYLCTPSADEGSLDLLPKISTHPALGATQIRCGPRDTFNPSHFVRKRRHGFLSRLKTRNGRNTLARRRAKKRSTLSH